MNSTMVMPVRVSVDGHSFVDEGGNPWFWLGDTQWHLFRSFPLDDVGSILEQRKRLGFSALQIMLIGYEEEPKPNIHGDLPWLDGDPAKPNGRYFEHVDQAMEIACKIGFLLVLGVYHKTQDRHYTPETARRSARWIAKRYRRVPNIAWSMYPEARQHYLPTVRAIAQGLVEGDDGIHMVTVHPDPSPQSSSLWNEEPWLSFNTIQTCIDLELVHPMTAADYALKPTRPVVMGEGAYEGDQFGRLNSALDMRRQAYWTFLAGGHHTYGHNDHYQAVDRWREWIEAPGAHGLSAFRRIVESLPRWWETVPDQSIVHRGLMAGIDLAASARARDGSWAMAYLGSPRRALIRLDRIYSSERVRVSWIDPCSGDRIDAGAFPYDKPVELRTPEGWEDALVLMEA